jgi:hypothetical protein
VYKRYKIGNETTIAEYQKEGQPVMLNVSRLMVRQKHGAVDVVTMTGLSFCNMIW